MRGAWLRQTLLTNNIANADTPGYQREDVNFEATLRSALANASASSNGEAGSSSAGEVGTGNEAGGGGETAAGNESLSQLQFQPEVQPGAAGPEGNGVSVDQESAQLAENGLDYQAMTQVLGARDTILRSAMGVS
jgi:flagellar basal-body rod protein FlgB